jgi:hypothetical protein
LTIHIFSYIIKLTVLQQTTKGIPMLVILMLPSVPVLTHYHRTKGLIVLVIPQAEVRQEKAPVKAELESAFKEICRFARDQAPPSFHRFNRPFWASLPKYRASAREKRPLEPKSPKY